MSDTLVAGLGFFLDESDLHLGVRSELKVVVDMKVDGKHHTEVRRQCSVGTPNTRR